MVILMEELFNKLAINPKDISLYKTAFSHSSYVNEHKLKNDYERLEFLGDAVLFVKMQITVMRLHLDFLNIF